MEEKQPVNVDETQPAAEPVPVQPQSEDLKQFSQWMTEYGRPALIGLVVAVVVLLGITVWSNQKKEKAASAVQALFQVRSPEELQQLALADPKAPTAPVALASAAAEYYAQNRFDEALEAYRNFLPRYPTNMLAGDVTLGVAASLEALDNYNEAVTAYESFSQENPDNPLRPQAIMGAARCREQLGQFAEARALYEDFIAANPESPWLPQAESGLLFLNQAERARNAPPVAVPATEPVPVVSPEAVVMPAQTPEESAPIATVAETPPEVPTASPEVAADIAPVNGETQPVSDNSKSHKKKSAKKKIEEPESASVPAEPSPAAAE